MSTMSTTTTTTTMTSDYIPICLTDSLTLKECKHASHCLLYSETNCTGISYVLVQQRFDGLIGFAGGEVDVQDVTIDDIVDATNREMDEEINLKDIGVTADDWICSHRNSQSVFVQHFFAKQLTDDQLRQIESTHMMAQHFPSESLGVFRVPIGGFDQKDTSKKFLRNFLRQRFAGNARQQFIQTLKKLSLVSDEVLQWIESNNLDESNDMVITDSGSQRIEVKVLLCTDIGVHYYNETVDAIYGLMIVRDDGLYDFIGTHFVDTNDKTSMIDTLKSNLCRDLGTDLPEIDLKSNSRLLSLDNDSSHVFCVNLSADEFTQIEAKYTKSKSYGHKSYGLVRIPFSVRGSTQKAHNYVKRYFNGFLNQQFANNSKMHLKHIYDTNYLIQNGLKL